MIIHSESSGCREGDEKGLKGISEQDTKNSLLPAHNGVMFELDNQREMSKKLRIQMTMTVTLPHGERLVDGTFKDT